MLTEHYFTGPERNNTHIGMPSKTDTDGVYLSLSIMEVVEKFSLEENVVGINSDGGGKFGFLGRHWSQNTPMTPFFHHPIPYSP